MGTSLRFFIQVKVHEDFAYQEDYSHNGNYEHPRSAEHPPQGEPQYPDAAAGQAVGATHIPHKTDQKEDNSCFRFPTDLFLLFTFGHIVIHFFSFRYSFNKEYHPLTIFPLFRPVVKKK